MSIRAAAMQLGIVPGAALGGAALAAGGYALLGSRPLSNPDGLVAAAERGHG